jgi:SpoVK/Ycf46/Vps4 family AAA+-type ATPase
VPTARHVLALLKSHVEGDSAQFYSTALQLAAHEATHGHPRVATALRDLVDRGRSRESAIEPLGGIAPLATPRGELANLLSVSYPKVKLTALTLGPDQRTRLERVIVEQQHSRKLQANDLAPRRKLLLLGPPGSGKTLTASAIAGELRLPLFTILLEGVITKFMGETAQKLRAVFDAMGKTRGVYLFDEFDAIGARRSAGNDVGEIRRVLNSFLQLLENDRSQSIVIAATNHPELLDRALYRRFDDVLVYRLPEGDEIRRLIQSQLGGFKAKVDWSAVIHEATGLSYAELARGAQEAAKSAVLRDSRIIESDELVSALRERRQAPTASP